MQIKQVKPINFLFFRTETTINELSQLFFVAKELFREAVAHDLTVTGPVHWHYLDFAGDATKPFTLEISLPVSEVLPTYDGKFHFKRTEVFKCISIEHQGNWSDITSAYSELMQYAGKNNLEPSGVNREVYVNADFQFPEANVTEVQLGVK